MPSTAPPTSNADLVRDRLRTRARRIAVIRRRVVATALATFALAFGTIAATGSLGATGTTGSSPTGSGQSDTATTATATTTGATTSGSTSSGSSASAVTTSQS